jgi:hypothetical protein
VGERQVIYDFSFTELGDGGDLVEKITYFKENYIMRSLIICSLHHP